MNLQQLEYIVALHKHKNFSKAAEACHISQATLSIMIKKLENELGVVLFDRKSTPVLTTDLGEKIIAEAKITIGHIGKLRQLAQESKGLIYGELNLGIIPTVAGSLLPKILPVLLNKYPDLKLNIQEITTANIIRKLKIGELDAGIISTPIEMPHLQEEILYYEKLLVYGHSMSGNLKYKSPTDLMNEKVWLLEEGHCLTDQIVNVCQLNPKKLHTNLSFFPSSFESLINIVDSMEGLTFIPELHIFNLSDEKKAHIKEFTTPYPVREISLVYFRPYFKQKLMETVVKEIKMLIQPMLETYRLRPDQMSIAKM